MRADQELELGDIYRHYKGQFYKLLHLARHSETLESIVVYQALYPDFGIWVRPKKMFFERLQIDGVNLLRFEKISPKDLPSHLKKFVSN
ncbi:MAG: DUF1653 domain-containing protein [Chlamydiae bacterium]|nr:DUF1653 domain-containing protein [Chlamydiota bacterium]